MKKNIQITSLVMTSCLFLSPLSEALAQAEVWNGDRSETKSTYKYIADLLRTHPIYTALATLTGAGFSVLSVLRIKSALASVPTATYAAAASAPSSASATLHDLILEETLTLTRLHSLLRKTFSPISFSETYRADVDHRRAIRPGGGAGAGDASGDLAPWAQFGCDAPQLARGDAPWSQFAMSGASGGGGELTYSRGGHTDAGPCQAAGSTFLRHEESLLDEARLCGVSKRRKAQNHMICALRQHSTTPANTAQQLLTLIKNHAYMNCLEYALISMFLLENISSLQDSSAIFHQTYIISIQIGTGDHVALLAQGASGQWFVVDVWGDLIIQLPLVEFTYTHGVELPETWRQTINNMMTQRPSRFVNVDSIWVVSEPHTQSAHGMINTPEGVALFEFLRKDLSTARAETHRRRS